MNTRLWICRSYLRPLRPLHRAHGRLYSAAAATTLPPALINRARRLAEEHDRLRASLDENYDLNTAKRVGELGSVATALRGWEKAGRAIVELGDLMQSKDKELRDLAVEEMDSARTELESLERKLHEAIAPKHPFAHMACMIEIRPGPGGMEGRLFADTLFKMYRSYCQKQGLRVSVAKYEDVDIAGTNASSAGEVPLAEAVLEVHSEGAYGLLRGEAGMHRVQRVPATEKSGRTHTSAVAVWVLPSFPESGGAEDSADVDDPDSLFYIDPAEVRVEKMRSGGAGGQHVNKTESAIRLTHVPTGTVVSMQDERSQSSNRIKAWRLLRARIAQQRREAREEQARGLRDSVLSKSQITRADKIRTYQFIQDRCTDHRTGLDVHNLPDVLDGGDTLDRIVKSVQQWLVSRDIEGLLAEEEAAAAKEAKKSTT